MSKFRKLISALLASVMLFGCASVMASAAHPDKIPTYWDEYFYKGELNLGETTVFCNEDSWYDYYVFNAPDDGYYTIEYDASSIGGIYGVCLLEKESLNYYYENSGVTADQGRLSLFYLYEGENYIGISFGKIMPNGDKVDIEYIGSEITDISFDIGTEYPMILGADIEYYGSAHVREYSLTFDGEKTVDFNKATNQWLDCYYDGELVPGENEIEIEFEGKMFSKTVTVAEITDYIEKVELIGGGVEETVYYDGSAMGNVNVDLKVTYTDGTSINANIYEDISLKNGNPNLYNIYLDTSNGQASVGIAGHEYLRFECEIKQASFGENLELLISNIAYQFNYVHSVSYYFEDMLNQDSAADTLRAFGEFVSFVNNQFMYAIGDIFEHITMFVKTLF